MSHWYDNPDKIILNVIIVSMVMLAFSVMCSADEISLDHSGDFSPLSNTWEAESGSDITEVSDPCCGSGPLRESPLDLSHLLGKKIEGERIESVYPEKFDLRDSGKVPPVRDQGQSGSCWDFAAMNSLESSLLPQKSEDYSENNLKNLVSVYYPEGFDFADGGNDLMASAYYERWSGPVPESLDPYDPYSHRSPEDLPLSGQFMNFNLIPGRISPVENDNIKYALMNFGCLYTTLLFEDQYYNSEYASYYNPSGTVPNHAVTLIGWDDTYSSDNFVDTPPGDGAFIAANSWGTSWGEDGFFYISYYDTLVGTRVSSFAGSYAMDFDENYGYDPLGWVNSFGFGYEEAGGANLFTAGSYETITAAGFYVPQVGTSVTVQVYVNPSDGPEDPSGSMMSETATYEVPGFHTLVFRDPVSVQKGDQFSVVVDFYTPEYGFPVPVEYPVPGYSSKASASPGQGYVRAPNGAWSDLTNWNDQANVCIRAYTVRNAGPDASFYAVPTSGMPPLKVTFTDTSTGSPERWLWQFGDGGTSTDQNPVHVYRETGTYSVSLTCDTPGGESKEVKEDYITVGGGTVVTIPDDYSLIQEAVNSVFSGSTIQVRYGYYPEQLSITKPVNIIGIESSDGQKPIIDAQFTGTPVSITASDVLIEDLSLTGAYSSTAIRPAVAIRGNDVEIRDCWIFENYAGIRCEGVQDTVIEGNIIWNSSTSAIWSESGDDLRIFNNTIVWTGNDPAVRLVSSGYVEIVSNAIAENNGPGFFFSGITGMVYNNYFNNSVNAQVDTSSNVAFNIDKSPGPNIVKGPYLGGNFWAAPDGSGFSETHPDLDGDGFCDETYQVGSGHTDLLPLASPTSVLPKAAFSADPLFGTTPLTVTFTDLSSGVITGYQWFFGDNQTSQEINPVHVYQNPGIFDVSLTVTGPKGTDNVTKSGYISVTGSGPVSTLSLLPGWNYIAVPARLEDGANTAAIFSGVDTGGHSIFIFENNSWFPVAKNRVIESLYGYWIYSVGQTRIDLYVDERQYLGTRSLSIGWNSIGTPGFAPVKAKNAFSSLGDGWVYCIGFDEVKQQYQDVIIRGGSGRSSDDREIRSLHGCWLYMSRNEEFVPVL